MALNCQSRLRAGNFLVTWASPAIDRGGRNRYSSSQREKDPSLQCCDLDVRRKCLGLCPRSALGVSSSVPVVLELPSHSLIIFDLQKGVFSRFEPLNAPCSTFLESPFSICPEMGALLPVRLGPPRKTAN